MTEAEANWGHLGQAVRRRREHLGLSQRKAAELAGGMSPTTWSDVEQGKQGKGGRRGLTLAAMARVLGWSADSIDVVLAGGTPKVIVEELGGAGAVARVLDDGSREVLVNQRVMPSPEEEEILVALRGLADKSADERKQLLDQMRRMVEDAP